MTHTHDETDTYDEDLDDELDDVELDDELDEDEEDEEDIAAYEEYADEVVLDVLDRVAAGERLDRDHEEDLGRLLGDDRAAGRLVREVNADIERAQREAFRGGRQPSGRQRDVRQPDRRRPDRRQPDRRRPRRGFWAWFAGPPHEQPDPLPDSVAAVLLRIQSGQPLSGADVRRLAGVVGRRAVRSLEQLIGDAAAGDHARDSRRGRQTWRGGRR